MKAGDDRRSELYLQWPSRMRFLKLPSYFGLVLSVLESMNLFAADCQGWGYPRVSLCLPSPMGPPVTQDPSQLPRVVSPCCRSPALHSLALPGHGPCRAEPTHGPKSQPGLAQSCPKGDDRCLGLGLPPLPAGCPASGGGWDKPCLPGPVKTFLPYIAHELLTPCYFLYVVTKGIRYHCSFVPGWQTVNRTKFVFKKREKTNIKYVLLAHE